MAYFITQDNVKLFYRDQGAGEPVVLIHGWPLHADMWENQALALLENGYRVISYDRRGFGRSEQPAGGYDYDTLAADLAQLITHLGLEQVSLVGFSMGGGEVARYLARYGAGKVARAALISSVVPYLLRTEDNPHGVPEGALEDMKRHIRDDRHHFLATFAKQFFGVSMLSPAVSNEVLAWTAEMASLASLKAMLNCVDAFGKTDFRSDLSAFTVPTLVVHGDADRTVPLAATGAAAAAAIPAAEYRVYEGAPHGLFITNKNRLSEDLLDFLGGSLGLRDSDVA